jgi:hypothetical protein
MFEKERAKMQYSKSEPKQTLMPPLPIWDSLEGVFCGRKVLLLIPKQAAK